jgi:hypothetical protein
VGVLIFAINAAIGAGAVKPNHGSPAASQYILPLVLVLIVAAQPAPSRRRSASRPEIRLAELGGQAAVMGCRSAAARL